MALLQISEPGQATAPHQHRYSVGIDLGTTNSLIATVRNGVAETLPNIDGEHLMPSIVHYSKQQLLVGRPAAEQQLLDPMNTIASVKRLMGRGVEDVSQLGDVLPYNFVEDAETSVPRINTAAGAVNAIEVSAEILKCLVSQAEETLGDELAGVVITVPAYFDDAQRQATRDAARLARLNVFRLLNEPTAAAVAYGLDQRNEGVIAVYDLGGGTFDISILRLNKGVFEVLATGGNSSLGGDDMDNAIGEWILSQSGFQNIDAAFSRRILVAARTAKESLTRNDKAVIDINHGNREKLSTPLDAVQLLLESLIKITPDRKPRQTIVQRECLDLFK